MALSSLDKMAKSDKPFFLYYGTRGTITSITTQMRNMRVALRRTPLGDCMVEMNDIFANLYKALEKNGQLDNTLIVFTSDNGRKPRRHHTVARRSRCERFYMGRRRSCASLRLLERQSNRVNLTALSIWRISSPTALDLAGHHGAKVANLVPKTTFIDGAGPDIFLPREQMVSLTVRPSTTSSTVNFLLCVWIEFKYRPDPATVRVYPERKISGWIHRHSNANGRIVGV
ncbi:sulfatase-like hydrolase/transferase [Escherichia coli]|nr:sulfatase-like hydrolase/transferase [Escherichia coli]